jgi:hypothetical protein
MEIMREYDARKVNINSILIQVPEELVLCRWVENIKIHLREIGWEGRDWIDLAQDRDQWRALVNTAMNLRVP